MKLSNIILLVISPVSWLSAQVSFAPPTPLFREVLRNDTVAARKLLDQGANPNEGSLAGFSPVFFVVANQNVELFHAMVAKGVDLHAKDRTGSTIAMWAAYDEQGRTEMLEEALRLGLDPNIKNAQGETALTWALRRGDTAVVRLLRKASVSNGENVKLAVQNAIAVLQPSGPQFVKISGCVSCHHQALPQMAFGTARAHGVPANEEIRQQQIKAVMAMFKPLEDAMNHETENLPDPELSVSYALLGLAAEGFEPNSTTAAMAHLVSARQRPDGSFRCLPLRPPLESSHFTATALSLRALQHYGEARTGQIERAAAWLQTAEPKHTEDRAMQLLGLHWAKTDSNLSGKLAQVLLAEQRPDGGWAQLPGLETDAYATGQALVALHRAGMIPTSDPAYQRGVDFLLRTQLSDGSWLVRTRSFPVQALKESGFPNGRNQWISASGTSWAVMALSLSLPTAETLRHSDISGF